ncbi:MAG: 3-keto-disaccharide hydrolase [Pirellulales bacterium]
MPARRLLPCACLGLLIALAATYVRAADDEKGFVALFDGKTLDGWQIVNKRGPGYVVEDGVLVCPKEGGGNLFTNKEYANFILRFEYWLEPGGNNGIGLRAPLAGDAAYSGMESQVLDDYAPQYADKLEPGQYHGSIYKVLPAKRGAPKKAGEWNTEEIICDGRHIKVTVNDQVIVDGNLDDVKDEKTLKEHPGMQRKEGHVGFLGHGTLVKFRNIRLKELRDPATPASK